MNSAEGLETAGRDCVDDLAVSELEPPCSRPYLVSNVDIRTLAPRGFLSGMGYP